MTGPGGSGLQQFAVVQRVFPFSSIAPESCGDLPGDMTAPGGSGGSPVGEVSEARPVGDVSQPRCAACCCSPVCCSGSDTVGLFAGCCCCRCSSCWCSCSVGVGLSPCSPQHGESCAQQDDMHYTAQGSCAHQGTAVHIRWKLCTRRRCSPHDKGKLCTTGDSHPQQKLCITSAESNEEERTNEEGRS